jgi:uncharacterized membrane protein YesL
MAGFFGLFNYSKAGPGVSKEEPQKKRFFLFFDVYFRKFWKLITLNLLYIACCLPIVTIGAATAGFTYVIRNFAREEHSFIASDFFDTIKKNWKMSSLVYLINVVFGVIYTFSFMIYLDVQNVVIRTLSTSVLLLVGLIFLSMQNYIYLLLVTFKLTFKQLYKNCFIFAIVGLWKNLLAGIIIFIFSGIIWLFQPISMILVITIFFSTCGFISMFTVYPIVKKYMIDPILNEEKQVEEVKEDEQVFIDRI